MSEDPESCTERFGLGERAERGECPHDRIGGGVEAQQRQDPVRRPCAVRGAGPAKSESERLRVREIRLDDVREESLFTEARDEAVRGAVRGDVQIGRYQDGPVPGAGGTGGRVISSSLVRGFQDTSYRSASTMAWSCRCLYHFERAGTTGPRMSGARSRSAASEGRSSHSTAAQNASSITAEAFAG